MTAYQAPLRDMQFVCDEVLNYPEHYRSLPGCEEVTPELFNAIRDQVAKFATEVLAPLNSIGDHQGCQWHQDGVTAPPGFKEAYRQFCEAG